MAVFPFEAQGIPDLFEAADAPVWIGLPYVLEPGALEIVPVQMEHQRFLMPFQSLDHLYQDDAVIADALEAWGGGAKPAQHHRLVKFYRADATADQVGKGVLFNPEAWALSNPHQVFVFGQVLVNAVLLHAEVYPHIKQYGFKPETEGLEKFYRRAFRSSRAACTAAGFGPILALGDGGYCGCERP